MSFVQDDFTDQLNKQMTADIITRSGIGQAISAVRQATSKTPVRDAVMQGVGAAGTALWKKLATRKRSMTRSR